MEKEKKRVGAGFGVLLIRGGKVLLGKRHDDAVKASSALHGEGTWTLPGGKMEFHETLQEAGKREVKEETGIDVKRVSVIGVSNDMVRDAHFVTIHLRAEEFEGEARVMEPDEITEWRWFTLDNLPKPLYKPSEKMLNNYKKQIFCSD
jgi:8-oxo-dGTP diphosphatase